MQLPLYLLITECRISHDLVETLTLWPSHPRGQGGIRVRFFVMTLLYFGPKSPDNSFPLIVLHVVANSMDNNRLPQPDI